MSRDAGCYSRDDRLTRPVWRAVTSAAVRDVAPSASRIARTWFLTVFSEIPNDSAI